MGVSVTQLFSLLSHFLFLLLFCFPAIALALLSHFTLALPTTPFYQFEIFAFQSLTLNDLLTEYNTVHNKQEKGAVTAPFCGWGQTSMVGVECMSLWDFRPRSPTEVR